MCTKLFYNTIEAEITSFSCSNLCNYLNEKSLHDRIREDNPDQMFESPQLAPVSAEEQQFCSELIGYLSGWTQPSGGFAVMFFLSGWQIETLLHLSAEFMVSAWEATALNVAEMLFKVFLNRIKNNCKYYRRMVNILLSELECFINNYCFIVIKQLILC